MIENLFEGLKKESSDMLKGDCYIPKKKDEPVEIETDEGNLEDAIDDEEELVVNSPITYTAVLSCESCTKVSRVTLQEKLATATCPKCNETADVLYCAVVEEVEVLKESISQLMYEIPDLDAMDIGYLKMGLDKGILQDALPDKETMEKELMAMDKAKMRRYEPDKALLAGERSPDKADAATLYILNIVLPDVIAKLGIEDKEAEATDV